MNHMSYEPECTMKHMSYEPHDPCTMNHMRYEPHVPTMKHIVRDIIPITIYNNCYNTLLMYNYYTLLMCNVIIIILGMLLHRT